MATLAECPSTALGVYGALTTGCHLTTTYRPIVQGESKGNDTITWERMLTDIRTAAQHVRRGGKVVFFFSGHGEILQQKLCLVDTAGKTMSVDRLHAAFCKVLEDRDADATGVVLVLLLDCCQRQVKGKTPDSPPVLDQKFTLSDNTQREYFIGYATSPCTSSCGCIYNRPSCATLTMARNSCVCVWLCVCVSVCVCVLGCVGDMWPYSSDSGRGAQSQRPVQLVRRRAVVRHRRGARVCQAEARRVGLRVRDQGAWASALRHGVSVWP